MEAPTAEESAAVARLLARCAAFKQRLVPEVGEADSTAWITWHVIGEPVLCVCAAQFPGSAFYVALRDNDAHVVCAQRNAFAFARGGDAATDTTCIDVVLVGTLTGGTAKQFLATDCLLARVPLHKRELMERLRALAALFETLDARRPAALRCCAAAQGATQPHAPIFMRHMAPAQHAAVLSRRVAPPPALRALRIDATHAVLRSPLPLSDAACYAPRLVLRTE